MVTLDSNNPFLNYARSLVGDMPNQVALVMGLMVFMAISEGASLLLLIPMLQIVGLDTGQGNLGYIAGAIAYAFSAFNIKPTLEIILILYISVVSLQSRLNRLQSNLSSKIQYNFITHIRVRFYKALANADYLYLSRKRSSDLTQLLMQEADRVGYGTFQILNLAANIIIALVYVTMAIRLSAQATALALISGICLVLLLRERTERSRITGRKIFQSNKSLYASALEHMAALKTTKSYSAEERNAEIFSRQAEEIGLGNIEVSYQYALVANLYETGSVIALSATLYFSMKFLDVSLASMLILLFLFARLMPKFATIQGNYQRFIALMPAFSSLDETVREMEEAAEVKNEYQENKDVILGRSVEFNDVHFAYDKRPILTGINLKIPIGQTVGLIGTSGSGKSTVADILIGLIRPIKGSILVDDKVLTQDHVKAWRKLIGYVSQDTFLFNDTVSANLLWACPEASEKDMKEALRLAAADEFVYRLPDGMNTLLGDRGVRLSGGERQRLALARAILRKPALLILDEATSNLDSESERRIQEAVESLHGSHTTFIITHRLSTLRNADIICILEKGRIVEQGSWNNLLANNGRFLDLCVTQGMEKSRQ